MIIATAMSCTVIIYINTYNWNLLLWRKFSALRYKFFLFKNFLLWKLNITNAIVYFVSTIASPVSAALSFYYRNVILLEKRNAYKCSNYLDAIYIILLTMRLWLREIHKSKGREKMLCVDKQ